MCSEEQIRTIVKAEVAPIVDLLQEHDEQIKTLQNDGTARNDRLDALELSSTKLDQLLLDLDRAKKVLYFIGSAIIVELIRIIALTVAGS